MVLEQSRSSAFNRIYGEWYAHTWHNFLWFISSTPLATRKVPFHSLAHPLANHERDQRVRNQCQKGSFDFSPHIRDFVDWTKNRVRGENPFLRDLIVVPWEFHQRCHVKRKWEKAHTKSVALNIVPEKMALMNILFANRYTCRNSLNSGIKT